MLIWLLEKEATNQCAVCNKKLKNLHLKKWFYRDIAYSSTMFQQEELQPAPFQEEKSTYRFLFEKLEKLTDNLANQLVNTYNSEEMRSNIYKTMLREGKKRMTLLHYTSNMKNNNDAFNIKPVLEKIEIHPELDTMSIDQMTTILFKTKILVSLENIGGKTFEDLFLELYAANMENPNVPSHLRGIAAKITTPSINVDLIFQEKEAESMCLIL